MCLSLYHMQLTLDVVVSRLIKVFARTDLRIYGWNLKFDFHVLKRIGISVATRDVFDGMLASWLCDENTPCIKCVTAHIRKSVTHQN